MMERNGSCRRDCRVVWHFHIHHSPSLLAPAAGPQTLVPVLRQVTTRMALEVAVEFGTCARCHLVSQVIGVQKWVVYSG